MAIESQKIISINTGQAIQSVKELKNEISSLRDAWLQADEGTEEYEQTTEKLVEAQTKLNQVMSVGKSQVSAATGSYNALVNQMNALKRVWRETTSEVQRQALGEKIRGINDQLKELDSSIGNNQRKVGAYEEALQVLNKSYDTQKAELRDLKAALDNLDPSTEAYNKAFERAAEITHNLSEQQEMLRRSANDFGTQLTNVADIGAGLVGGFNAIKGIMVLTGNESEELTKVMAKLQAGIAVVQGLKGIDGLTKAVKGYVGWASKAYDAIKNSITGRKAEAKQIQATTIAAEANAAVNNQVAASETAAATGAKVLGAGMQTAAVGTTTATVAMTALKAALMSLGIGLIIAAISGLITMLGKLGSKAKEVRERDLAYASLAIDKDKERLDERLKGIEREGEAMRAEGKSELEVLEHLEDAYSDVYLSLSNTATAAEAVRNSLQNMTGKASNSTSVSAQFDALEKDANGKLKSVRKEAKITASEMLAAVKYYTDNGSMYMREMLINDQKVYDKMLKKGVKTYEQLAQLSRWYYGVLKENNEAFLLDPVLQSREDISNETKQILKEAEDAVKSESKLEKERYDAQVSSYTWTTKELQTLADAHNKKMYEIYKSTYRGVLEALQTANQERRQNLETEYQRELRDLKEIGAQKMAVTYTTEAGITKTVTAEEALRLKYAKERSRLELEIRTKSINDSIKELERYASSNGPMASAYDKMEAAGVERSTQLMKLLVAKQNEIFQQNQFSLSRQVEYWDKLWQEIKDDETLTLEQREAIYEKYVNAKMALEKLETQHTLDQIKARKEALDAEIAEIEKVYDRAAAMQARTNERENDNGKFGKNGGKMTWGGGFQYAWNGGQQSYNMMREGENENFKIEQERLNEQIALYHQAATDMSLSEAERTAAKEKESLARAALEQAEYEHTKRMVAYEKEEYQTLINTITSVGDSISQIMGSIYDTIESTLEYQVKAGKISEDQMNEQLERYRWIQYAQAIINTASGALGAFTQASATIPPPYGQIVGAAAAAAVVAQGVAQIAAIRAASKNSSIDSGSKMQPVQMQPAEYQPDYTANLTGKSDTDYLRNAMDERKLFVSVTDINSVQSRVKTTEEESGF